MEMYDGTHFLLRCDHSRMMSEPSGSSFKPLEGASLLARYAVWIIAFHLFSGAALLSWIEGWDPFTALYFCIICVTTVVCFYFNSLRAPRAGGWRFCWRRLRRLNRH